MKDTGKECSCDPRTQEKSFLVWWARLTDYCWELFRYNLWYLLFALPSFLCILIFLVFNAHLFLLAGLILLIPAGPAMLTLYEAATKIAAGELRTVLPRFFSTYKRHCRPGFAFSFALVIIVLVTLYPVYFVLVTNSVMKIAIMICASMAVLLLCCLLPHIVHFLISGEHHGVLKKAVIRALRGGKASFFAGLLQATWLFCCMIYPYVAVFAALLGIPAVIRMTVMYILPQAHKE
jgi:hypothetical protein